ncbi:hypothetical protein B0T26DRAFT_319191 [Lasiosphaeria miniovina]|uniref:Uncharacterized protein n=1 Tax=Lasiosphaeria miniovina TaxID=1954250 RepID=A0AA40ALT4_9PEZI|nr:uncharacterized protein B0T26DRAFT_319191 [Lasiosphaeria miniovina]KAK0718201.1 hypothetical protein B0T26DRAFT_319191 [Lasiosphaeria miniovina]
MPSPKEKRMYPRRSSPNSTEPAMFVPHFFVMSSSARDICTGSNSLSALARPRPPQAKARTLLTTLILCVCCSIICFGKSLIWSMTVLRLPGSTLEPHPQNTLPVVPLNVRSFVRSNPSMTPSMSRAARLSTSKRPASLLLLSPSTVRVGRWNRSKAATDVARVETPTRTLKRVVMKCIFKKSTYLGGVLWVTLVVSMRPS